MVDFVRLSWRDKAIFENFVCQEENFEELHTLFNLHTSEIKYPYVTGFSGMDVRITEKRAYVYNSIHKAYNQLGSGVGHNHNDFAYSGICFVIDHINKKLIDVDNSNLTQLEFGFNIKVPIPAEEIINNNLLMHKTNGPNHVRLFNGRGKLKQFDHYNYVLKIYDKGRQYNLTENILRFEVRFMKAKEFQKFGIFKLEDLKDKHMLRKLFKNLIQRFDELVIIDQFDESSIEPLDLSKLNKYNNPYYWETTIKKYSATTKMRHFNDYSELLNKYNLLTTKIYIRELLLEKYLELINF
ncbi:hypothetical protein [Winogradskyella helgolandensis]|uniref:hypothetical protein n=1 Tax=Winogradskyella helgolandensis TaxID=2697010 RepID=UPI0015C71960|nr:hypothetical protein [Winogradskyella helgolandensis]